jgi:hypothetical protein
MLLGFVFNHRHDGPTAWDEMRPIDPIVGAWLIVAFFVFIILGTAIMGLLEEWRTKRMRQQRDSIRH